MFSDHETLELKLNTDKMPRGPGLWIFNASLLRDENYNSLINSFWENWKTKHTEFQNHSEWWEMTKI